MNSPLLFLGLILASDDSRETSGVIRMSRVTKLVSLQQALQGISKPFTLLALCGFLSYGFLLGSPSPALGASRKGTKWQIISPDQELRKLKRRVRGASVYCAAKTPVFVKTSRKTGVVRIRPVSREDVENDGGARTLKRLRRACARVGQDDPDPPQDSPSPTPTIAPPTPEPTAPQGPQASPLALDNSKSGISLSLSGQNGTDWVVEQTFHEASFGDQVIYLKSDVSFTLAHNERNSIMKRDGTSIPAVLGIGGLDGNPETNDAGNIHYKIDRDMQSHLYSTKGSALIPPFAPQYLQPFRLDLETYDGTLPVLGSIGDNGGPWGSTPRGTNNRFAYGQLDPFGTECHTLTYWDDDEDLFRIRNEDSHRQGASDGHWIYVCVNPAVPVIQMIAPEGEEFYTTPLKTYHIPKTWKQTTYLSAGVLIKFFNLATSDPLYVRVNEGSWMRVASSTVVAGDLFQPLSTVQTLEVRRGTHGPSIVREVVLNPDYPAPNEEHGFLLWGDEFERAAVSQKITAIQPFKRSYEIFTNNYYQASTQPLTDVRGGWCSGAGQAGAALSNAFTVAIDGPEMRLPLAQLAKQRLLRAARLEPVGYENDVGSATPSKDYLNELGQTIQTFADLGIAYDLVAAHFRRTHHPDGMSPIEELRIRDGLAEIAKSTLQFRDNWSATHGSGDTHWAHGYELAIGTIALAMPTYKTPYFGVSGADFVTHNDLSDENGEFWNPLPNQGISWYAAATDAEIETPGYPNNRAPLRSEFQISDDGYWTGPNDLQADGDRYTTGPMGNRIVDVKYGGLANAESRVELVEMDGYESPFVGRIHALDFMRRLKGDTQQQSAVTTYIRRRLLSGYRRLNWDPLSEQYDAESPRIDGSILAFNNHYEFAGLPSARAQVEEFLLNLNRYYGFAQGSYPPYIEDARKSLYNAYTLALFWDPSQVIVADAGNNTAPIIKPLFKYVLEPGDSLRKQILAMDLNDEAVSVQLFGLPAGASFNPSTREITWTPSVGDVGVYRVLVRATDGTLTTERPFPLIVKQNAGAGPIPAAPNTVTASVGPSLTAELSWESPPGVSVAAFIIYRDGSLHDMTLGYETTYVDREPLPPGSHTRYDVALLASDGSESMAVSATPAIVSVPR